MELRHLRYFVAVAEELSFTWEGSRATLPVASIVGSASHVDQNRSAPRAGNCTARSRLQGRTPLFHALLSAKGVSSKALLEMGTGTKTSTKSQNHFSESALDKRWKFSERTVENLPKSLYCHRNSVRIDASS